MENLDEINHLLSEKRYYYLFNRKNRETEKKQIKRIDFEKKENSELGTFYAVFDGEDGEIRQRLMIDELKYGVNYINLCMNCEKNKKVIGRLY